MPRKPATLNTRKVPPSAPPEDEGDFENLGFTEGERADIEAFFEEFPSTCWVQIVRIQPNGERAVCETVPYEGISEDPGQYVRDKWGPGKFHFRLKDQTRKYLTSRMIIIADVYRPAGVATTTNQNGGALGGFDMVGFLQQQLIAQQKLVSDMMLAQMQGGGGGGMAALISGLGSILKPPDPTAMMAQLATTFQSLRPAETAAPRNPLEEAEALISLAKKIGGESSDDWPSVIRDVGSKLAETVGPRLLGAGPKRAPAKTEAAQSPDKSEESEGDDVEQDFYEDVREGIQFLHSKANTRTVEFWCAFVVEGQNERHLNAVLHAIRIGGTVDQLFDFEPKLKDNPQTAQWFRDLYVELKKFLGTASAGAGAAPASV